MSHISVSSNGGDAIEISDEKGRTSGFSPILPAEKKCRTDGVALCVVVDDSLLSVEEKERVNLGDAFDAILDGDMTGLASPIRCVAVQMCCPTLS